MRVFASWSGNPSHRMAQSLQEWLPKVLTSAKVWVSDEDITKGSTWSTALWTSLRRAEFGILCLVPGNIQQPWVVFEAGVLAGGRARERVSPFLLELGPSDLPAALRQFQCTCLHKRDVLRLVRRINDVSGKEKMSSHRITRAFNKHWPALRRKLKAIDVSPEGEQQEPDRDMSQVRLPDEPGTHLDSLHLRVLRTLANTIYDSMSSYALYLEVRQPQRRINIKLIDLMQLGFVTASSRDMRLARFKISEAGTRFLDKRGLV